jgi:GAF domain-containing protein
MTSGTGTEREARVVEAFVDLADSLVADYDQLDFLYRLLEHGLPLVGADAGGVLLHYEGRLHLVASSSEASEDIEVFEVQHDQGPAQDAFRTGELVRVDHLADAADRWPGFVPRALAAGWTSAVAHPLRLRDRILGAVTTFHSSGAVLDDLDEQLLRGFADVAAIAVIQRRVQADVELVNEQLHVALESRITVEQAKGMVVERTGMKPAEAFEALRRHARSTHRRLKDVAAAVVNGELDLTTLT